MIILSIDSGIEKTGYAIFKKDKSYKYLSSGLIKTDKNDPITVRIKEIYNKVKSLIIKYKPNTIVLEQVFFFRNQKTAIKIGQTQGAIILIAGQYNISLNFLTPLQIKLAVTGYGQADKKAVKKMVELTLNKKVKIIDDDQSDAIACGLTYCILNKNI